jgi:HPP family
MRKWDLVMAPACEGALLLLVGLSGWAMHKPLLFASLGPTVYELIETPERASARTYNIFVGHLVAVLCGFAGLFACHAFQAPGFSSGTVAGSRIGATAVAAALTVLFTLLLKATQPAAVSTTLLIALGSMQKWQDGFVIMGAVAFILVWGEPLRTLRLRQRSREPRIAATD